MPLIAGSLVQAPAVDSARHLSRPRDLQRTSPFGELRAGSLKTFGTPKTPEIEYSAPDLKGLLQHG